MKIFKTLAIMLCIENYLTIAYSWSDSTSSNTSEYQTDDKLVQFTEKLCNDKADDFAETNINTCSKVKRKDACEDKKRNKRAYYLNNFKKRNHENLNDKIYSNLRCAINNTENTLDKNKLIYFLKETYLKALKQHEEMLINNNPIVAAAKEIWGNINIFKNNSLFSWNNSKSQQSNNDNNFENDIIKALKVIYALYNKAESPRFFLTNNGPYSTQPARDFIQATDSTIYKQDLLEEIKTEYSKVNFNTKTIDEMTNEAVKNDYTATPQKCDKLRYYWYLQSFQNNYKKNQNKIIKLIRMLKLQGKTEAEAFALLDICKTVAANNRNVFLSKGFNQEDGYYTDQSTNIKNFNDILSSLNSEITNNSNKNNMTPNDDEWTSKTPITPSNTNTIQSNVW